jgi:hypothetical protein
MSYTFTEHKTDGISATYPFAFAGKDKGYIRASDVTVQMRVSGVWQDVSNWSLTGTNQITFTSVPPASAVINLRIRRIVPKIDPYAEFARGVTLDMRSLNYSFIQNLQVVQELMDGFFPDGFFYKEDLNMGFNKIINLSPGTNPDDAVNFSQLSAVDQKHTTWNTQQDLDIFALQQSLNTGTSHNTVPWAYTAIGGETIVAVPYIFTSALVFIRGVLQYELRGAVRFSNNTIIFAEPLPAGADILVLVGSRISAPEQGEAEINLVGAEGQTEFDLLIPFAVANVFLDGLRQQRTEYTQVGTKIVFTDPVPSCAFSALVTI